jgi:hypothetical protein
MTAQPDISPATPWRRFASIVAVAALLLVFAGFARTYYLKGLFAVPTLPPLVHLHGFVMTGWFVLFLVQTMLVAARRTDLHRRLGVLGAGWALLVLVVGVATAIHGARRGFTPGPPPLVFLVVPVMDLIVFAALIGTALLNRHRPDIHRRLMLLGTISILAPAVGRLPFALIAHGGLPVIFGLVDLGAVACVVYDTWRNRRLHPAFGWGLLVMVASIPLRVALAGTGAWHRFATWLIS